MKFDGINPEQFGKHVRKNAGNLLVGQVAKQKFEECCLGAHEALATVGLQTGKSING